MISREELLRLADFECRHPNEMAVSFYFQPATPKDKSHREEVIEAKDLVRRTVQELEVNGRSREVVADLQKILQLAERLHGNQARAKAVFACSARQLWLEFDLPPSGERTRLFVNRRLHLKPLASLFSEYPRLWVALVDRQNARFLEMYFDEIKEQGAIKNPAPRHGHSDGFGGYDAGHAQRHSDDEARRHYRMVSEFLKGAAERTSFRSLIVGCRDVSWLSCGVSCIPMCRKGRWVILQRPWLLRNRAQLPKPRVWRQRRKASASLLRKRWTRPAATGAGLPGCESSALHRIRRVDSLLMSRDYSATIGMHKLPPFGSRGAVLSCLWTCDAAAGRRLRSPDSQRGA
jgi:hypothetical protein